ncbi:MAG: SDR family NAD(P)-dependent oxidoreductase, partial [Alphaproteobacteria bacterium]
MLDKAAARVESSHMTAEQDPRARVTVITGATSGIGRATALDLAARGDRLVCVGRSQTRGERLRREIARATGNRDVTLHTADLSSVADARRVAARIAADEPAIDILINNAGAIFQHRRETHEGLEMTFALNHCGYFVIANALMAAIAAAPMGRIVNVTSEAHRGAALDMKDLQSHRGYSGWRAYQRSKLANILFTRALQRRAGEVGVAAVHPGFVATRFGNNNGLMFRTVLTIAKATAISPARAAARVLHPARDAPVDEIRGRYFADHRAAEPSPEARDDDTAERLWARTEQIVAE